jgi:hypothetical protein
MGYSIEVDFEVKKKIWSERKSEDQSDNDVLRGLLQMPPAKHGEVPSNPSDGNGWIWKGVRLPVGTQLRMNYLSQLYEGEVRGDGKWWVNEMSFTTPSEAADSLARTRKGKRPSLDGWRYWYVKRPSDRDWIALDDLRKGLSNAAAAERPIPKKRSAMSKAQLIDKGLIQDEADLIQNI